MVSKAMTVRAALLAGSILASGPALAQEAAAIDAPAAGGGAAIDDGGQISGTVLDANGAFVSGAEVRVEGQNIVATTDSEGRFLIRRVAPGAQQVTVSYFGADPVTRAVAVEAGRTADLTVTLAAAAEAEGEAIVVTGSRPIAESEAAALQAQRASTSLVSVVAADSIGRFPDQNIAASLSRLPGIAVQRDQGQERFVSLRGARTNWTTISFDGINVISPAGRTTRFDTIPSAIASRVIVRKAVTPDMTGETVAGNIDIRTRGPFDYPGFRLGLDLGLGFSELGGGRQYNLNGFVSQRFADDTLGILLSASRYERDMITDNFEAGWEIAPEDREPGREERIWANNTQNKLYRLTRSNTAFSGRLDWRPAPEHELFLSSIHTEFRDDELRNAYVFDFDENAVRTDEIRPPSAVPRTGYADIRTGNTPLEGTLFGVEIDSTLNSNSSRQRIFTNTLGGEHDLGLWSASWHLNYTRAQADSRPPFQSTWRSPADRTLRPTIAYDLTDRMLHRVRLFDTIRNTDGTFRAGRERPFISPTELDFVTMTRNDQRDQTDAYTARLDISRDLQLLGAETRLQFGGQYDRRKKESNRVLLEARAADLAARGIPLPRQADISIDTPFKGEIPLGYGFRYFSNQLGRDLFDSFIEAGATRVQPNTSERNFYDVREEILAGYAMATTYFDWGNVVGGARVERVRNDSRALTDLGGSFAPARVESENTLVFPSLHLNYDLNPEMKLRLSFNTGAARPDYTVLRPNFTFNDTAQTISGGNPLAKPERARGADLYYEWYMASRGFLSVGAYYKEVKDVLFAFELAQFGLDVLNSDGIDRSTYRFNTTANGGSGRIKGIEFAYSQPLERLAESLGLPDWMHGFGIQANLTLNDSEATTPDGRTVALPGASDLVYNTSLYYERYGLSARVSWQYRSSWLDSLGGNPIIGDNFWDNVGRLDVSARYAINRNVELFVDANNLLDEPGIRYVGDPIRTLEFEKFGARYLAGARINF